MKQSERLLVYVVTGFLAVILVIAVVFGREPGRDPAKNEATASPRGLDEMFLGDQATGATKDGANGGANDAGEGGRKSGTGLPGPSQVTPDAPLVAGSKPALASDLISQQLGVSRRDRTVRFVRARAGDSLESIVRRWCGAREPYVAEARSLNEEMVVVKVGQEVAVPWVDDETLLASIEAQKPKMLLAENAVMNGLHGSAVPASSAPDFRLPGGDAKSDGAPTSMSTSTAGGASYLIKSGDSLWKIAERTYGRKNADRMIRAIKAANPGLTDRLSVDQKILLPADAQ